MTAKIDLDLPTLREVAAYAAWSAGEVIAIFERLHPSDSRPRDAIAAAAAFAGGGRRVKALRDAAWAALKAASETNDRAASAAARAAMCAPAAAFLHPLARSTQVRHILGAATHAAHAVELAAKDSAAGENFIDQAAHQASPTVIDILFRYPRAPSGGGRAGELLRSLDQKLRDSSLEQTLTADDEL